MTGPLNLLTVVRVAVGDAEDACRSFRGRSSSISSMATKTGDASRPGWIWTIIVATALLRDSALQVSRDLFTAKN